MSSLLFAIRSRLRAIFRRGAVDREMRDEMALHLEQAVERLRRRGMSDADAREAARREFGNVALLQEEGRDARGARWIESSLADVRFAFRHFARTPLTAVTLVLVLALGIGVNSALFSVLQALTLRPAPGVPADDALVRVRGTRLSRTDGRLESRELSMPEVRELAARRETFTAVAAHARQEVMLDLNDGTDTRSVTAHFVTSNYFTALGIRPAIGVGLPTAPTDDTPGAELAVMIAHSLWEQMGADTSVVGRAIRLNGVPVRVVGVAPPRFRGATLNAGDPLLWIPLAARASLMGGSPIALTSPDSAFVDAIARLAPNVTAEHATGVARVIASAWTPDSSRSAQRQTYSSDVVALRGVTDVGSDREIAMIAGLLGTGALLVLLVACTNVSALLIGAAVARRREIAIRLSLGASRLRVVRQLVTESTLIALTGGALGLAVYWAIVRLIVWMVGDIGIGPDLGTIAFTAAVAIGTGVVFGLSPALHATRLDVSNALKSAGGGGTARSRLQRTFIVAQIMLTQPLLVGLALVIAVVRSEAGGPNADDPLASRIIRVEFATTAGGAGSHESKIARVAAVMHRVAALPGVEAVVQEKAPMDPWLRTVRVHPDDRGSGPRAEASVRVAVEGTPPGYFALQNRKMLRGRELLASDTLGRDMGLVIDGDLARQLWGPADPVGKRLEVTSRRSTDSRTAVVVGVVLDSTREAQRDLPYVYTADSARWSKATYLVRTQGPGASLVPDIRRLARASVPDIPIFQNGIATREQLARMDRRDVLQVSAGAAAGGAVALLLASIGLYGVVALAVRQRQREIGIRIALGARPGRVIGMFFASGLRLSVLGLVLGLPLSIVALRVVAGMYVGAGSVGARPSQVMLMAGAGIAVVVVAVASVASWIPARRAARVDPLVAIRVE